MERVHRSAKLVPLVVLATLSLAWTSAPPVLADTPSPTNLRAVPREGALAVHWGVTSEEGLAGFRVRYRPVGTKEWSTPIERPAQARGVKISALRPQPYQVRVRVELEEGGFGGVASVIGTPLPLGGSEEEPPEEEEPTHLWGATSHGTRRWASSDEEVKKELAKLQAARANLVRTDLDWGEAEPTRGTISSGYRERLALFLNEAAARGIKVLATIEDTPAWASPGGAWYDSPSNPETMGAFARWLTREYGSKLVAVAVWNEPLNPSSPIVCPNGEARAVCYTALVKAVFKGAREGNAVVKVLAGSVGPVDGPPIHQNLVVWLDGPAPSDACGEATTYTDPRREDDNLNNQGGKLAAVFRDGSAFCGAAGAGAGAGATAPPVCERLPNIFPLPAEA